MKAALRRAGHFGEEVMARILLVRASVDLALGRPTQAASAAGEAALLFERNTLDPSQSADVGEALLALARAKSASGDAAAARLDLERASASLRAGLGADHALTLLAGQLATEID